MSITCSHLLISIIISLYGATTAVDLQCDFKFQKFTSVGNQYTCFVQNSINILDSSTIIDNILGTPKEAITALSIDNANIHFIPSNLGEKLPNLVVLKITNSKLKEIHQSSLKSLTKLQFLNLDGNLIEELEEGLFEFNPELQLAWFYNNKIKKIGSSVFSNLRNLTSLDLSKNACISKKFVNYKKINTGKSQSVVSVALSPSMLSEIATKCSGIAVEATQQIETTTTLSSDQIYQAKIAKLESRLLEALLINNKNQEQLNAQKSIKNKVIAETSREYEVNRTIFGLETDLKVEKARVVMLKEQLAQRESEIDSISDDISKAHESIRRFEETISQNYAPLRSVDKAEIRKLEAEKAKLRQKIRDLLILIRKLKEASQAEILKAKEEIDGLKILLFKDETQEIEIVDSKLDELVNLRSSDEVVVPLIESKVDEATNVRSAIRSDTTSLSDYYFSTEQSTEQSETESSEFTTHDPTVENTANSTDQSYTSTIDDVDDDTKSFQLESTHSTELDGTTEEIFDYSTTEDNTGASTDADLTTTYKITKE